MATNYNTIPEPEYFDRVNNLISAHIGKTKIEYPYRKELFILYNDRFLPKRNNTACSSCVAKVWRKIKAYHKEITEAKNI